MSLTNVQGHQAPLITLLITVYDEEKNLFELCRELQEVVSSLPPHEIVIVDDGSQDESVALLKKVRRDFLPQLRIISHDHNCGKSASLRTGARYARGTWIATMDGDGQDRPSDLARLVGLAVNSHQKRRLYVGVRRKRADGIWRLFATRIANFLRRGLFRDGCPDTGAPIKVFPRDIFLQLPSFEGQHRFLPALFRRYGCDVTCALVDHRPRRWGQSHYTNYRRAIDGALDLLGVMWLLSRTRLPRKVREQ